MCFAVPILLQSLTSSFVIVVQIYYITVIQLQYQMFRMITFSILIMNNLLILHNCSIFRGLNYRPSLISQMETCRAAAAAAAAKIPFSFLFLLLFLSPQNQCGMLRLPCLDRKPGLKISSANETSTSEK